MRTQRTPYEASIRWSAAIVIAPLLLALAACAADGPETPTDRNVANVPASDPETIAGSRDDVVGSTADRPGDWFPTDAYLVGRLGAVSVDAVPHTMEARVTPESAHISLFAEGDGGGQTMIAMAIRGGLDHPRLVGGEPVDLRGVEPTDPSALWVNLIGCSGETAPDWDYDQGATDVTIRVDPPSATEDSMTIEIEASFGSGLTTQSSVTGYVVLGR